MLVPRSPRRTLVLRFVGISALLILVAAGCSQSGDDERALASSTSSTTSTVTPPSSSLAEAEPSETTEAPEPQLETGFGVSDATIRVGYSLDLTGPYQGHDLVVRDVHQAYFDELNADGGVAGRQIELVVLDNGFDVPLHLDNVAALTEQSETGAAILGDLSHPLFLDASISALDEDGILVVSGLEPRLAPSGANVVTAIAGSICQETEVALHSISERSEGNFNRLAIIARDESWAVEAADTARALAEQLGLQVVLDVADTDDLDSTISQLSSIETDVVWLAVSPRDLIELSSVIEAVDREWIWAGTSVTLDNSILASSAAPALAEVYTHVSGSQPPVGSAEFTAIRQQIAGLLPDLTFDDAGVAVEAWTQAERIHAALIAAVESEDMTRAGIARSARSLDDGTEVELYSLVVDATPSTASLDDPDAISPLMTAPELDVEFDGLTSCR